MRLYLCFLRRSTKDALVNSDSWYCIVLDHWAWEVEEYIRIAQRVLCSGVSRDVLSKSILSDVQCKEIDKLTIKRFKRDFIPTMSNGFCVTEHEVYNWVQSWSELDEIPF